jgi:hypothetical protein
MMTILVVFVLAVVAYFFLGKKKKAAKVEDVISNWYHLFEGLKESPQPIYAAIEQSIQKRQLTDVRLSRVDYREGGILSAKREYLRVTRNELVFDICAAPFGTGFFVSWWLGETKGGLWGFPLIGPLFTRLFRPATYFRIDTTHMFQELIRGAVLEVIDQVSETKGLRGLTELERKPTMKIGF